MIDVMVTREPVECVMLAAGESRRMGRWKMLLPLEETTVVERSVENALVVCDTVYLVVGHRGEELMRLFAGRNRVVCVANRRYAQGMFSSVKTGVARLKGGRCFLALADMPLVSPKVYRSLLEASPAESASYRLAKEDKARFPDIRTPGSGQVPYYTNSTHLPVNCTDDLFEALTHQDSLRRFKRKIENELADNASRYNMSSEDIRRVLVELTPPPAVGGYICGGKL